jgi:hypothetical protein
MNPLNIAIIIFAVVNLSLIVYILSIYAIQRKVDKLRDYDRKCRIEAERKARDER